jgi:hypothetical protein
MSGRQALAKGEKRLRAALRRLRGSRGAAQRNPPPPQWGSEAWASDVVRRLEALENRARTDRLLILMGLAVTGVLERLNTAGLAAKVIEALTK